MGMDEKGGVVREKLGREIGDFVLTSPLGATLNFTLHHNISASPHLCVKFSSRSQLPTIVTRDRASLSVVEIVAMAS